MPEFICKQCCKDDPKEHCKVHVTYTGWGESPTGCLYKSMREEGFTGQWTPYYREKKKRTDRK